MLMYLVEPNAPPGKTKSENIVMVKGGIDATLESRNRRQNSVQSLSITTVNHVTAQLSTDQT